VKDLATILFEKTSGGSVVQEFGEVRGIDGCKDLVLDCICECSCFLFKSLSFTPV
jgi:hypothetical protein